MRYPSHIYAKALHEAIKHVPQEKRSAAVKRFLHLVERNGDMPRISEILREIEKLEIHARGGKWVLVEYAREIANNLKEKIADHFSNKDYVERRENPSLIAGARIIIDGEKQLDYSFANALKKMFG